MCCCCEQKWTERVLGFLPCFGRRNFLTIAVLSTPLHEELLQPFGVLNSVGSNAKTCRKPTLDFCLGRREGDKDGDAVAFQKIHPVVGSFLSFVSSAYLLVLRPVLLSSLDSLFQRQRIPN